ncbi:hypothetical protein Nepgr_010591 [Nepenthes gracilis]|uniref:Inositol polyphosphate-related phosphatase domain-containing protein n=1 Tax=Nepenthes gracilis TaxID=150966 RepID=A0AAD3SDG8_NEPGR|nr:hypothetical protein Nepgr_010591 [Nepenthes gracilis]
MDDCFEDEDRDVLATIANAPLHRAVHCYSQQLRAVSSSNKRNQMRKHSLDEDRISKNIYRCYDFSDDDFYPYSESSSAASTIFSSEISHRYDNSLSIGGIDGDANIDQWEMLPEFMANGSGTGIFKAPSRAAVHPNRPSALELRPHPLRETQVGKFLRTIGCTDSQLWAGLECGVRFWNIRDAYEMGNGLGGRVRRGDEDAAPFYESWNTSPAMCLVVDEGNGLVWTGHKDGKIRSWKMDQTFSEDSAFFKEGLTWQAHRCPVLSMIMSSYGDIWAGFEGGVIKIWPWDAIEKSLSLSPEEKHMAALLVERSSIDLRSQVTVNGICNITSSDVKLMLTDCSRSRVWCAASVSFSLWDARTKELVKVFNIDGQIENRIDMPAAQDQPVEDEGKVKFVSSSKKEKSPGFLQRSRNAIIGAADAVRRATRGAGTFNEDNKKTEAIVTTADGIIWSGCSNGLLVKWDGNGNRLQDVNHHPCSVLCFCTQGSHMWVGYASGVIQLLDLDGNLIAGWVAHNSPVVKLAIGAGYVFSLATHGGIRGWNLSSPGPVDNILRSELAAKELLYTRQENFKILVGTWNVGQEKASPESLRSWLGSAASDVGIVVVGLQEVEMGAGFLAMSVAKETVGLEGSAIGQWWQDAIGKAIDEVSSFERVGSRQLAGLLISIWVRKNLRTHVGDLDVAAVACGLGRTIGNKGGVGLRLRVHDRIMCFVNCHLAAHLEAVNRRNADFDHIYRTMVFTRQSNLLNVAAAGVSSGSQVLRAANAVSASPEEGRPDLSEADMVIFLGDFNYRLFGISYDEARDFVSQRSFDWLREKDQLREEMKAGKVFQGMREAIIRFPPTYKFERHKPGLGGYDSGEKKRIPAWCDRIIYRDNRSAPVSNCSLECPIVSSIMQYEACMDVTDSDHKPVRCKFYVRLSCVDRSVRRQEYGKIIKTNDQINALLQKLSDSPETMVNTDSIILQNQEISSLQITNKCRTDMAAFQIICEGQSTLYDGGETSNPRPRGSFGFPNWLEVTPAAGIIKPDQVVEVTVRHTGMHTLGDLVDGIPQNWCSEDTRDKQVILAVIVRGSSSTERRIHRVRVRHCYSMKTIRIDSRTDGCSSRKGPNSNSIHCSEI